MKITFIHPDLGIGGAERLVVDAALELKERGHQVCIYTSRHDRRHCLAETIEGGIDIRVHGNWIPPELGSRLRAPSAILRMALLFLVIAREQHKPDIIFCDLVPHVLPLLRFLKVPLLFYCHYPDFLLTKDRRGWYRLYRLPLDWLEQTGLRSANKILVNSRFTANVFQRSFSELPDPEVLYPGVPVERFDSRNSYGIPLLPHIGSDDIVLLSLNRFDPRKNLEIAVESLNILRQMLISAIFKRVHLIIAGACDARLQEQIHAVERLKTRTEELNLTQHVSLVQSPDDEFRLRLLQGCYALIYTSPNEHFGIGIVEGMAAGKPVVATKHGGPCEIIQHGIEGYLVEPLAEEFAKAFKALILNPEIAQRMGIAGRQRSQDFSRKRFGERLEQIMRTMSASY